MTKKHFIVFASIFKARLDFIDASDSNGKKATQFSQGYREGVKALLFDVAEYFAHENALFNRERFFSAVNKGRQE